jgi:heme exporter protein B
MLKIFICILYRDLIIALRRRADVLTTLLFFIIVVSLFPLSISIDKNILLKLAPGVIWVAALLASMLALERLFANDYADGTLEQMLLVPQPLLILVMSKIIAHWILTGLPLVLITPLAGFQYGLSNLTIGIAMLSLLLGTPTLSAIGAIGAALTLGLRSSGVLLSLMILPLYIPILIYGAGAITISMFNLTEVIPYLALLGTFLLLSLTFAPLAVVLALHISVD